MTFHCYLPDVRTQTNGDCKLTRIAARRAPSCATTKFGLADAGSAVMRHRAASDRPTPLFTQTTTSRSSQRLRYTLAWQHGCPQSSPQRSMMTSWPDMRSVASTPDAQRRIRPMATTVIEDHPQARPRRSHSAIPASPNQRIHSRILDALGFSPLGRDMSLPPDAAHYLLLAGSAFCRPHALG